MENILITGAHFDDTELGVGGTASKLISLGKKVYKFTLTDNETDFHQRNIRIRYSDARRQSAQAAAVLGIEEIENSNPAPCSALSYNKQIMQQLENIIFDYKIDTVFMHSSEDMNQDHVEASRICRTAARHCAGILEFQSNGYAFDHSFQPNFFIDISDFADQKKKALMCYSAEHDRMQRLFTTNIEKNHVWGYANEVEYAEGFRVIKMLG